MAMLNKLRLRLRALFFKSKMEDELQAELQFHLEREREENIARGMTPEEARYAAIRSFGGVERVKEESRDVRGIRFLEEVWQDLRYGARMLAKKSGFTLIAVIMLALGIGANTAIFSVINAVLLRSLPYPQAERLVMIWQSGGRQDEPGQMPLSPPELMDYRAGQRVFRHLAAHTMADANLSGDGEPERLRAAVVSEDWFAVLDTPPLAGRTFVAEEHRPQQNNSVVLSYGLWQRRFGGDIGALGRSVVINGRARTIAGIMPMRFRFPAEADLWLPLAFTPEQLSPGFRSRHYLNAIARCKDGITPAQAQENVRAIASRFPDEGPEGMPVRLVGLREQLVGQVKTPLYVLLAAVGFVLLIACANVGNLLLSRTSARQSEMAIRQALGAGRRRLLRQLLTESMMLSLLGALFGTLLAWWGAKAMATLMTDVIPRAEEIRLDGRVLAFTFGLAALSGLLFGLAPAWQTGRLSRGGLIESLKQGAKGLAGSGRQRTRQSLAVTQIALALVLLMGAGLLLRSFCRLTRVDPGFKADQALAADIALPFARYDSAAKQAAFYQRLVERLQDFPGTQFVGIVSDLPLSGMNADRSYTHSGIPSNEQRRRPPSADYRHCSPAYFSAIGMTLLRGRAFTEQDAPGAQPVAIVNQALARQIWPNEDAVGKQITFFSPQGLEPWRVVVGVVGDVKHHGLNMETRPEIYVPHAQAPTSTMTLVMRAPGDATAMTASVREAVRALDADLPLFNVRTLEQLHNDTLAPQRFNLWLLGAFACIALALAALGIYGVLAYSVSQRTHEIGLRLALGAQARDVLRLILRQALALTLIGLAIGWLGALALLRLMQKLLFEVSPTDPLTFVVITLLLLAVSLLACYVPARRATKVDPLVALRCE
jgi:putative ABC transport system permease protein